MIIYIYIYIYICVPAPPTPQLPPVVGPVMGMWWWRGAEYVSLYVCV